MIFSNAWVIYHIIGTVVELFLTFFLPLKETNWNYQKNNQSFGS